MEETMRGFAMKPGAGARARVGTSVTAAVLLLLALRPGTALACVPCTAYDYLCCDIPADGLFYLTSFEGESMACGGYADGAWYYSTSWVRWYCGARLAVANPETDVCVVVEVADAGPAAWVEESAGMPILDASTVVCGDLFGYSGCGWSDGLIVEVRQVDDDTPLGAGNCPGDPPCIPSPEVCDGMDNDCDTIIDDGACLPDGGEEAPEAADADPDAGTDADADPDAAADADDPGPDGGGVEDSGCGCMVAA